jgi:hypothetical protein
LTSTRASHVLLCFVVSTAMTCCALMNLRPPVKQKERSTSLSTSILLYADYSERIETWNLARFEKLRCSGGLCFMFSTGIPLVILFIIITTMTCRR